MGFRDRMREARAELEEKEERKKKEKEEKDPYFAQCGSLVVRESFGVKVVEIYQKGYVRIGTLGLGPPEKLLGISATDGSSNKSGVGRGAAAIATLGVNYLLSESKRGDLYLTIITDKKTHSLHQSPPSEGQVRSMLKIEAAGKAVLGSQSQEAAPVSAEPRSLAAEIAELKSLHEAGVLSEDEFNQAKAKLLGS